MALVKIGAIVQKAITSIHEQIDVIIHYWDGKTTTPDGRQIPSYSTAISRARMQPLRQDMISQYNLEIGKTYRSFYLLTNDLQTINRNISTAGDYIQVGDMYYRIVRIPETFDTGWQHIIGIQGLGIES